MTPLLHEMGITISLLLILSEHKSLRTFGGGGGVRGGVGECFGWCFWASEGKGTKIRQNHTGMLPTEHPTK